MSIKQFFKKTAAKRALIISVFILIAAACIAVIFVLNPISDNKEATASYESESSSKMSSEFSSEADNGIRLIITSPASEVTDTTEPTVLISGTSDPDEPLILNGNEVQRDENGAFAAEAPLSIGKNTFTFLHKNETVVRTVNYRFVVINGYAPSKKQLYPCGSTFGVSVSARLGSRVYASFCGNEIELLQQGEAQNSGDGAFCSFTGRFTLPDNNLEDISLGRITFRGVYDGISETFYSGEIICKRPDIIVDYDPNATPLGGRYINVGSGKIAEIVDDFAETFDAYSTDDRSRPTNNYLPKGTVDYSAPGRVYYSGKGESKEYAVLRYGKQVYTSVKDKPSATTVPIITEYAGTLPDHNEIGFASLTQDVRRTVISFDCLFKAPFYFDLLPQNYTNPGAQDYTVSNITYSYVDITFCYATVFRGEPLIPENNPLFSSAAVIKNQSDFTLRLYLKKQGGFYGWDSYYNNSGQLCFSFLHPAQTVPSNNAYGINLTGVKILIDAGHNGAGIDTGAMGADRSEHCEAGRNLILAQKLKAELESMGASVIMTRYGNASGITFRGRMALMRNESPDLCISIHHDSSTAPTVNGFGAFHSTVFSKKAAEFIQMRTYNAGIYAKVEPVRWHYFFLARSTVCPVVLTENGYISSPADFAGIKNDGVNTQKAKAIASGVADYFNSIRNR